VTRREELAANQPERQETQLSTAATTLRSGSSGRESALIWSTKSTRRAARIAAPVCGLAAGGDRIRTIGPSLEQIVCVASRTVAIGEKIREPDGRKAFAESC
jgi:hypothetical protein